LLAAWLEELVFLAETEGFVPDGVDSVAAREGSASGVVTGRYGSPPHLVKGVTYHDLVLAGDDRGWRGRVVLDV
jgi:SHS2 domain-containing protein